MRYYAHLSVTVVAITDRLRKGEVIEDPGRLTHELKAALLHIAPLLIIFEVGLDGLTSKGRSTRCNERVDRCSAPMRERENRHSPVAAKRERACHRRPGTRLLCRGVLDRLRRIIVCTCFDVANEVQAVPHQHLRRLDGGEPRIACTPTKTSKRRLRMAWRSRLAEGDIWSAG